MVFTHTSIYKCYKILTICCNKSTRAEPFIKILSTSEDCVKSAISCLQEKQLSVKDEMCKCIIPLETKCKKNALAYHFSFSRSSKKTCFFGTDPNKCPLMNLTVRCTLFALVSDVFIHFSHSPALQVGVLWDADTTGCTPLDLQRSYLIHIRQSTSVSLSVPPLPIILTNKPSGCDHYSINLSTAPTRPSVASHPPCRPTTNDERHHRITPIDIKARFSNIRAFSREYQKGMLSLLIRRMFPLPSPDPFDATGSAGTALPCGSWDWNIGNREKSTFVYLFN